MGLSVTNTYNGKAIPVLLQDLYASMDIFTKNLVAMHTGITLKKMVPRVSVSAATLKHFSTNPTPSGSFTVQERFLEPQLMLETIEEIEARKLEEFWEGLDQANPEQALLQIPLIPKFRDAFGAELIASIADALSTAVWTGTNTGTNSFDGFITTLDAEGGFEDVSPVVPAAISVANLEGYLADVRNQLLDMKALLEKRNVVFLVSKKTAGIVQDVINAKSGKGETFLNMPSLDNLAYYGIPIISCNGFPNDRIICTYVGPNERDSNLHVGMRNMSDMNYTDLQRMPWPKEQMFGMKCAYSMCTQWAWTKWVISLNAV